MHGTMYLQTRLFSTPIKKEKLEQERLLNELIKLKREEIQRQEFKNFYGNAEQVFAVQLKVAKKVDQFTFKVQKAFPELKIIDERGC
ncbi:hypothetical protein AWH56_008800 [Anaerobacillus isosaccharinicus]|uniref:Uncharacterized protein n=1 Tax=Anaerobacillus isosaccharinicus TaxID=1532552 RepID=A0A1S2L305_9BACI|nr:hypothetical protein [Anaerobacillus isosaccharinicus]MBA5588929.1 hypothetical protein [Anaerobacillus isosaccharinicus]QOY37660.1 hypothetical protein AWH56_008800 [Anaerobacillus isosaccharinicus]